MIGEKSTALEALKSKENREEKNHDSKTDF